MDKYPLCCGDNITFAILDKVLDAYIYQYKYIALMKKMLEKPQMMTLNNVLYWTMNKYAHRQKIWSCCYDIFPPVFPFTSTCKKQKLFCVLLLHCLIAYSIPLCICQRAPVIKHGTFVDTLHQFTISFTIGTSNVDILCDIREMLNPILT